MMTAQGFKGKESTVVEGLVEPVHDPALLVDIILAQSRAIWWS